MAGRPDRNGGACAHEGALIGVDPHKATVAIAAVDEVVGELVECATFLQNRAGLRDLERSKRNGSLSVVGRWRKRWRPRGRHLAQRLAAAGESVVDVPPKLSARVRVLSTGNARKNDGLDALATALAAWRNERLATVDPEAGSEVLCASFPRGAKTWWPSVPGRSRPPPWAPPTGPRSRRALPGEHSRPIEPHASCAASGRKAPRLASAVDWLRRSCA
jgi:hypothetical protein